MSQHFKLPSHLNRSSDDGPECPEFKRTKSSTQLPIQLTRTRSVKRFHRKRSVRLVMPPLQTQRQRQLLDLSDTNDLCLDSPMSSTNEDSDLESLPDTDASTPNTSPLHDGSKTCAFPLFASRSNIASYFEVEHRRWQQSTLPPELEAVSQQPLISIFDIPEIVYKIVEIADLQNTVIPQEGVPIRRKPLSFKHAMLIYGNEEDAWAAMHATDELQLTPRGVLYNCLLVNKLFNQVTTEFINRKVCFSSDTRFAQYLSQSSSTPIRTANPSLIVLHKLFRARPNSIELLESRFNYHNLEWVEFFMCPKLLPSLAMFDSGLKMRKFIVTGSKVLDDLFLSEVSRKCPNLEVFDIRACEMVSDAGIYSVGKHCRNLRSINLGRKKRGHLITDCSLSHLVRNNPNLNTIGLAGCDVTDKVIWDIAIHCNLAVERLSLNNCRQLTNQSIPIILHSNYLPNLSVLELRFVDQLTNFLPIIEFKRRQEFKGISILIEVCEELCNKMKMQEVEMDRSISKRIFQDILDYVNDTNDDDASHASLVNQRRRMTL